MSLITEFEIPALPPSLNSMYKVNYMTKQFYLDTVARNFKMLAFRFTPKIIIPEGSLIHAQIYYYGNWFNKNKTVKKKDGQNLDKCLYDSIFEKLSIDDSHIFSGTWEKIQSDTEKTRIILSLKEEHHSEQ